MPIEVVSFTMASTPITKATDNARLGEERSLVFLADSFEKARREFLAVREQYFASREELRKLQKQMDVYVKDTFRVDNIDKN